jgi:hypothetical protein
LWVCFPARVRGSIRIEPQKGNLVVMDLAVLAQLLSACAYAQAVGPRRAGYDLGHGHA